MTNKRRLAAALALTVVVVMLCSVFFLFAEADHDCAGENCAICLGISRCENTLRSLAGVFFAVLTAAAFSLCTLTLLSFRGEPRYRTSPVSLKVKLSD